MPATARPSEPRALLAAPIDVPAPSKRCPHPCTRRRTKPYSTRRRAPHAPAPPLLPIVHPFDQLPWIPALDATPGGVWDIADLSQLPDSRPALIARRLLPDLIQTPPPARPSTPASASPCDTHPSRPTTPLSRFVPSRVLFHNLMPVLCDSGNDSACTSSPLQLLN